MTQPSATDPDGLVVCSWAEKVGRGGFDRYLVGGPFEFGSVKFRLALSAQSVILKGPEASQGRILLCSQCLLLVKRLCWQLGCEGTRPWFNKWGDDQEGYLPEVSYASDLFAASIRDSTGRRWLLVSFQGDSAGLSTAPTLCAIAPRAPRQCPQTIPECWEQVIESFQTDLAP